MGKMGRSRKGVDDPSRAIIGVIWNGIEIKNTDFDFTSGRDRIAWELAFVAATHCGTKAAALELLREAADHFVEDALLAVHAHLIKESQAAKARQNGGPP